ncbi:hypothetical protein HOY82DRAFT_618690 [Tuber indicum]|nr:hypothetical protein HOY82DRAFT_618690 [Tuber indicum]
MPLSKKQIHQLHLRLLNSEGAKRRREESTSHKPHAIPDIIRQNPRTRIDSETESETETDDDDEEEEGQRELGISMKEESVGRDREEDIEGEEAVERERELEDTTRPEEEGGGLEGPSQPKQLQSRQLNLRDLPRGLAILPNQTEKEKRIEMRKKGLETLNNLLRRKKDQKIHPETRRRELALQVAETFGRGMYTARRIVRWELEFLEKGLITPSDVGSNNNKVESLLEDEGVQLALRDHIARAGEAITAYKIAQVVNKYIAEAYRKQDLNLGISTLSQLIDTVSIKESAYSTSHRSERGGERGEKEKEDMRKRRSVTTRTIRRWLRRNGYNYTDVRKGVYIDGHEREDVVAYRERFVKVLEELWQFVVEFEDDGKMREKVYPNGCEVGGKKKPIIIITHDESTFSSNDSRRQTWVKQGSQIIRPKGRGQGIMYGRENGYWEAGHLIKQVIELAIPIAHAAYPGYQFLFLFDNSSNHGAFAPDALLAQNMSLGHRGKQNWLRDGYFGENGQHGQSMWEFYINEDGMEDTRQKGIKRVLEERGLWPESGDRLLLECPKKLCNSCFRVKNCKECLAGT